MVVNSIGYFYSSEKLPFDWGRTRILTSDWGFMTIVIIQIPIFIIGSKRNKRNLANKDL